MHVRVFVCAWGGGGGGGGGGRSEPILNDKSIFRLEKKGQNISFEVRDRAPFSIRIYNGHTTHFFFFFIHSVTVSSPYHFDLIHNRPSRYLCYEAKAPFVNKKMAPVVTGSKI